MKHLFLTIAVFLLVAGLSGARAQSLVNTNWKTYIADPVNDTLILHIRQDSSFVTNGMGSTVVKSVCKISGDTMTLTDYDGEFACAAQTGRYKVTVTGDAITFVLIDDPCDGRAGALPNSKWRRVTATAAK